MLFEFVEHDALTKKARDTKGHGDMVSVLSLFDPARPSLYILVDIFASKKPIVHHELSAKAMRAWIVEKY